MPICVEGLWLKGGKKFPGFYPGIKIKEKNDELL
jgi:hypothetical protein